MSKELTPGQIISTKKSSIRKLNNLLEGYINSNIPEEQKKAYLISSWLQQFVSFISFENNFDPTKNISYKRGNVIKVNLGFNVGCELGGPHYAIVLDKNNKHSSDTVTIIPLVSTKEGKDIYERDVFLGNELYNTLNARYKAQTEELEARSKEVNGFIEVIPPLLNGLKRLKSSAEINSSIEELEEKLNSLNRLHSELNGEFKRNEQLGKEISFMKEGSIARIEQITSISKMRIWIPKKSTDALYNISYSENTMRRINEKVKELFVFDE